MNKTNIIAAALLAGFALAAQAAEEAPKPAEITKPQQRTTIKPQTAKPALDAGFVAPPSEYRPQGFYFMLGGCISKDGLTKDLEAMNSSGIGGGLIMDAGSNLSGPVGFFNDEWRGLIQHTFQEADRLDLQFGMATCPGYQSSGGPWVPVEEAMKQLGWTETLTDGPGRLNDPLPRIPITLDFYRDVAVIAYPEMKGGGDMLRRYRAAAKVTADGKELDLAPLIDRDLSTKIDLKGIKTIEVDLPQEVTICSAMIGATGPGTEITMSAKTSDGMYRPVVKFKCHTNPGSNRTANFAPVTAKSFRFEGGETWTVRVSELGLGTMPMIANASEKAGFIGFSPHSYDGTADTAGLPPIPTPDQVIDLTSKLRPDGTLDWDVPPGTWTILRFGMTAINAAPTAGRAAKALECDKLDATAMRHHLENYIGVIAKDAGPLAGKRFTYTELDSYELPTQNWTEKMPGIFRARRGYQMGPWMAALTGRTVGSIEETERFLWDFRRAVADQFAEAHYGTLRKFMHERGMLAATESYGPFMGDSMQCSGQVDMPMAEFWWKEPVEGKSPPGGQGDNSWYASVANTYGKNIVGAEAFSTAANEAGWRNHPRAMKALGDNQFLSGINRFIFHAYPHQAYDVAPGLTFIHWGSQFGRHVSWWPLSRGWHDYVSRCQYLLRQGRSQSDVAKLIVEGSPEGWTSFGGGGAPGYRSDHINTEVVLDSMSVRDGKLVLPCGAEYYVLVTCTGTMRIEMVRKLAALVEAGGVVVGPKPERTLGLKDWRKNEAELKAIADAVWGTAPGEHAYGKGRVYWSAQSNMLDVLKKAGAQFDCSGIPYLHRTAPGFDAYFLVNNSGKAVDTKCVFRVSGRQPELWDPLTGEMTRPREVEQTDDGHTSARVTLPVDGSIFVVFRKDGPAKLPIALDPAALQPVAEVTGPWEVAFEPNRGAPPSATFDKLISWPDSVEPGIKYFSGVATYRTKLNLPAEVAGQRLFLDLGKVADVARVHVNGTSVGYAWAKPLRVEITSAAKPGVNTLEIEVADRWINRLIGDEQYPDDAQYDKTSYAPGSRLREWPTWFPDLSKRGEPRRVAGPSPHKHYTKDSPLVPAGLLGPVTVWTVPKTHF